MWKCQGFLKLPKRKLLSPRQKNGISGYTHEILSHSREENITYYCPFPSQLIQLLPII